MMNSSAKIGAAACLLAALATAPMAAAPTTTTAPDAVTTLRNEADTRTLEAILNDQTALLDALQSDPNTRRLPEAEKERQVLDLTQRYEALLERRPDDAAVMILYGKFLRLVDARAQANQWFTKADARLPDMPVIKHQLGVYAAEEGNYVRALSLLEAATRLEPKTAVYHYHFGEFLATYQKHLVSERLLSRTTCDAKMQAAFARAAELNPAEAGYRWRHAESFFDCESPDWRRALAAWDALAAATQKPLEREVLSLYRARVLLELGQRDEAARLVEASKTPQLETTRAGLRKLLRPTAPIATAPIVPAPPTAPTPTAPAAVGK
jgi:tetratricopeptide (TPR) repeat protein